MRKYQFKLKLFFLKVSTVSQRIFAMEDSDVSGEIRGILESEGLSFTLGADILDISAEDKVSYLLDDLSHVVDSDAVLLTTGRWARLADLILDKAGVKVDAFLRSSVYTRSSSHDQFTISANINAL